MERRRPPSSGVNRPLAQDGGRVRPGAVDLDDVVYGIHAVEEALAAREPLRRIHLGDDRKRDPALRGLLEAAQSRGIVVRYENRAFFNQFPYRAHQSVVAFGVPFDYLTLEEAIALPRTGDALFVVLDHITDPHNAGAIVRSAECAGATAVVLPERRSAGINGTVRKASAGATAHVPIARVANISNALRVFKKHNVWVAGAAMGEGSVSYVGADLRRDLAIVIGAEGDGLSPVARKECDFLIHVPMHGRLDSLNASVAAGILLFETLRQRGPAAN